MRKSFPNGVYPVMLTPFTEENHIDYPALRRLTDWYIDNGAAGLFADCQSSEMFCLSLQERVELAKAVREFAGGRVPVVASGHVSDTLEEQAEELNAMARTGVDAVILLTNRLAKETENDQVWMERLGRLLEQLPLDTALGFYECPYPYKRLISPENLKWCADTGRFFFLKDTSCDIENIRKKLEMVEGTPMKVFNANTSTLLETLRMGVSGFSGVMANFHPELYAWLYENFKSQPEKARILADFLTIASLIERQVYPVNAKYYHILNGTFQSMVTRVKDSSLLTRTGQLEVEQLARFQAWMKKYIEGKEEK